MKRTTKLLSMATVIGLLAIPVAQADWASNLLWNWVLNTGYPMLQDHEARLNANEAQLDDQDTRLEAIAAEQKLVIVDGTGRVIRGQILDVENVGTKSAKVAIAWRENDVVVARVLPDRLEPADQVLLYHESADCSGTGYFENAAPNLSRPFYTIRSLLGAVYKLDGDDTVPVPISYNSISVTEDGCFPNTEGTVYGSPAFFNGELGFLPPYTLEFR